MWKKIFTVLGALAVLGTFSSGIYFMESRYAKADDARQNRVNIKINGIKDDIRWYQDQMTYIMSRCGTRDPNKLPEYAYQNYMNYKKQKEALEKELLIEMGKRKY